MIFKMSIYFPTERQLTRFKNNIFSQVFKWDFWRQLMGLCWDFSVRVAKCYGVVSDDLICKP